MNCYGRDILYGIDNVLLSNFTYKFVSKFEVIKIKMVNLCIIERKVLMNILCINILHGIFKYAWKSIAHGAAYDIVRDEQIIFIIFYVQVEYSKSNINDRYQVSRFLECLQFCHRFRKTRTFWNKFDRSRLGKPRRLISD